ncbi:Hypothetical protein AJAP_28005 [Amycolatopsis japonica]|uniref:Uncharacterized protein n=1 Tax=Amycolatopsis japonica TaxID=208439 RepID=A0A075V697_9PSEU|nr:hypothetical protein [Amycolatopsis japonica]AIG78440.1 Hypothetical protein AJAP_28005 [Amycolatopsis japonica]
MSKEKIRAVEARYRAAMAALNVAEARMRELYEASEKTGDYASADDFRSYNLPDARERALDEAIDLLALLGFVHTNAEV